MRSFFKKPTWANTDDSSPKADFYRRSDQIYEDVVAADREKAGKKHGAKTKAEETRPSTPRKSKRRRISRSEEADTEGSDAPQSSPTLYKAVKAERPQPPREQLAPTQQPPSAKRSNGSPITRKAAPSASPATASRNVIHEPPKRPEAQSPSKNGRQAAINISDDDDEDDGDSVLEEDEFPELAQKARERARLAAELQARDSPSVQAASAGEQHGAASPQRATQPAESMEPKVEILVTSDLENSKSLLVRRKLVQNLKDVRTYWCGRQEFSPEMTASVFLTWKGKRLFDVTTCKSLGIDRSHSDDDLFESKAEGDTIRVHMEAVTEELFQAQKRQRSASFAGDQAEESEDDEKDPGKMHRVTLKGPGIEDLPMKVRPITRIANIISTLQDVRSISPDKTVHLLFDGERLDPGSIIADCDIADLDCVDVLIR